MKKFFCLLLSLSLLLLLAACGGSKTIDTAALTDELVALDAFTSPLVEQSEKSVSTAVKLDTSLCVSYRYYIAEGYTGEEFGVFECTDSNAAKTLESQLTARAESLAETYSSYNQEALPRINSAVLVREGVYVVFVIADDAAAVQTVVDRYFA